MFLIDNGGCHVEYTMTRTGPYLPEKHGEETGKSR